MTSLAIASATLVALSLTACTSPGTVALAESSEADGTEDYRISVEIPLEELRISEAEILKINELLDERTGFNAEDFQLDEVVLIARSEDEAGANAELLVLEWRSGQVAIPPGSEEDWFEVRVPAPEEDNGGAWLLDITGTATVDLLVAVLAPRPRVVEKIAKTKTVYRTRTVYRDRYIEPRSYHSYWIYEPSRYYTIHYHGTWPYRYFIGPWDYRHYDLTFRPYRYHYGPIYRPRPPVRPSHRHRAHGRDRARAAETRRISRELVQLRRSHPRLRTLYQRQERQRPNTANARYQEAKYTHPRLRTFHRTRQTPSSVAERPSRSGERRQEAPSRARPYTLQRNSDQPQRAAPDRRSAARSTAPSNVRSRALRQAERRPTAAAPRPSTARRAPTASSHPMRANARSSLRRTSPAAQSHRSRTASSHPAHSNPRATVHRTSPPARPTRRPAVREATPQRTIPRTRTFERPPRQTAPVHVAPRTPKVSPRQPSRPPVQRRSSERIESRSAPAAPSRSRTTFERR